MNDEVIIAKAEIIERCAKRIREEYDGKKENLYTNQTKQDAIILNIERACQATIDLATHLIRVRKLGLPRESREAFSILCMNKIISDVMAGELTGMVGFRNTVIHEYQKVDLAIIEKIITTHIQTLKDFAKIAIQLV